MRTHEPATEEHAVLGPAPLPPPLPAALPVAFDVRGQLAETLRRVVEGPLGWQVVDRLTAPLIPPAVRLVDVSAGGGDGDVPTVLVVTPDDVASQAAAAALRLRPRAIVAWPATEDELAASVTSATTGPRAQAPRTLPLRVGGAAGGVGTTTIALTLAGLAAWRGSRTLVVSGDQVLLPDATPTIDAAALAAPEVYSRGAPLLGVPTARAVRALLGCGETVIGDPTAQVAILDVGVADEVDVLVLRPDAAGLDVLGRAAAAAVVVIGRGPVPERVLAAAIDGRRRIDLPISHRVARAAVVGRVPSALPGRFVRALLPLLPAGGDPG